MCMCLHAHLSVAVCLYIGPFVVYSEGNSDDARHSSAAFLYESVFVCTGIFLWVG